mmetsp:Transcript_10733/g.16063  ORF Transcript_10733/g.16063 Transcript_10733/m.16063 type:complete len:174 (+) Transcript_10733:416-937(+)
MLRQAIRNYTSISGSKARIIDNFDVHYQWMNQNKPALSLFYFKNSWNPECSRSLQKDFLKMIEHEPFATFVVNSDLGAQGEKVKRYYCVKYEPTFLFLSDGMEVLRVVGSDLEELTKQIKRIKEFRRKVSSKLNFEPGVDVWENFHDEYIQEWHEWSRQESWEGEGTIIFDRN